jgi:outer membrane protein assembly factor BamD (BamD/ComL family)
MDRTILRPLLAAVAFAALTGFAGVVHAQKADTVRPEVGKPLQAAQGFVKQRKGREALAEVAKAEAVGNRTPYENFLIQQMKGSAAMAAGDSETAIKSFEAVLGSGRVSGREATSMVQAVAVAYYQKKDYPNAAKWTQRYFKEGGTDASMRTMLLQSHFLGNDCGSVQKMVATSDDGRRVPSEEELQMLANCYDRAKDSTGYANTMEKLVANYPKKEYWTAVLARVQKKSGFSDRLGVNVYRLRFATNNAGTANDYMEMAQLAMQAGVPAEAKVIIDKGYQVGQLGKGDQAERHERLRKLVDKTVEEKKASRAADEKEAQAAKDGNALVNVGLNYVYEGDAAKGLPLVEQGIKKGGLKRPEDAKLRYGEALLYAGRKDRAVQVLREVKGADGTADIARLWVLQARA